MTDDITPKTVYKREKAGASYYSAEFIEPDKSMSDALETVERLFKNNPEALASARAELEAERQQGEETAPNYDNLKAQSDTYKVLGPMARETNAAVSETVLALLLQEPPALTEEDLKLEGKKAYKDALDKHLKLIRKAYGKGWQDLQMVAQEFKTKDGKRYPTGKMFASTAVCRALEDIIEENRKNLPANFHTK